MQITAPPFPICCSFVVLSTVSSIHAGTVQRSLHKQHRDAARGNFPRPVLHDNLVSVVQAFIGFKAASSECINRNTGNTPDVDANIGLGGQIQECGVRLAVPPACCRIFELSTGERKCVGVGLGAPP